MKKLSILCVAVLMTGVAFAGIYDPDYRGDENSVHVIFEKPTFIPPGAPAPLALTAFDIGPSIYPLSPEFPAADYDGFSTHIILPNFIDDLPLKKMRIQMVFETPVYGADLFLEVFAFDPILPHVFPSGSSDLFTPMFEHFFDFEIIPNPDMEEMWITNHSDPKQFYGPRIVEIDTVSIPEPASLGMLALVCGFGLFIRRRFLI